LKSEQQARAKAEKQAAMEAKRAAKAEAARVEAKQKAKAAVEAEVARVQAEQEAQAAEEKARREAEAVRLMAEQQARVKADEQAAQAARAAHAATPQGKGQFEGVDWSGQPFWLVETGDVRDRNGVSAAWRDLRTRFPKQMEHRTILPRHQGRMSDAGDDSISRYQLFVARFSEEKLAEEFCAMLRAAQQRCRVVSSQSLAGKDGFHVSSTLLPPEMDGGMVLRATAEMADGPALQPMEYRQNIKMSEGVNTADSSLSKQGNDDAHSLDEFPSLRLSLTLRSKVQNDLMDMARVKADQIAKVQAEEPAVEAMQAARAALAAPPSGKGQFDGVDWSGPQFWLVEMADVHDRNAVSAAWRDLRTRFPRQMENRTILPRRQGRMSDAGDDSTSRYRLFIARFPEEQVAEEVCGILRAAQQRCGVVSSQSLAGIDGLHASSTLQVMPTDQGRAGKNEKGRQP